MPDGEYSGIRGSGARLITVAEAAGILRVGERAVRQWIADGLIVSEALPDGEARIRLSFETQSAARGYNSGLFVLDLHRGLSTEKALEFDDELAARRREHELEGLVWTDVDVDAFTSLLAARLAEVVPDSSRVRSGNGMIMVAGSGIDVARLVADGDRSVDERLILAAESVLEEASDALAELTSEPWPARAGAFPGGFPPFAATISDGELRMRYGREDDPILELRPIKLDAVEPAAS